jgi:hypothetical protein
VRNESIFNYSVYFDNRDRISRYNIFCVFSALSGLLLAFLLGLHCSGDLGLDVVSGGYDSGWFCKGFRCSWEFGGLTPSGHQPHHGPYLVSSWMAKVNAARAGMALGQLPAGEW